MMPPHIHKNSAQEIIADIPSVTETAGGEPLEKSAWASGDETDSFATFAGGEVGYWFLDKNTKTIRLSDNIYSMFGFDKAQVQQNGRENLSLDTVLLAIHPNDIGGFKGAIYLAMDGDAPLNMKVRIIRPGPTIGYIWVQGDLDRSGVNPNAMYGVILDITTEVVNRHALQRAKEKAEASNASKSSFLANMSHELRTPLNTIMGFADMMRQEVLGELGHPDYKEYADAIFESSQLLRDLINDVLDMSKIEAGKYTIYKSPIDMAELTPRVMKLLSMRARDKSIEMHYVGPEGGLEVDGDKRALQQILLNLLTNAIKFTEEGGEVFVSVFKEDGMVVIQVKDNGIGIPTEDIHRILEPFEQVQNKLWYKETGTGLGLPISKALVEKHGGTFVLESTPDFGTTVTVKLPELAPAVLGLE